MQSSHFCICLSYLSIFYITVRVCQTYNVGVLSLLQVNLLQA